MEAIHYYIGLQRQAYQHSSNAFTGITQTITDMFSHINIFFITICVIMLTQFPSMLQAASTTKMEHIGIGINLGSSYDPDPTFGFAQITLSAIYDYETIMHHQAPEPLKFKFEGNLGFADYSGTRLLTSFNFYALYYLRSIQTSHFVPYIEGGAGIVYSDFQVEGQGLRINFNPQAGVGCEWKLRSGTTLFSAVHAYHISNGGLDSDNRGINGILFQMGYHL